MQAISKKNTPTPYTILCNPASEQMTARTLRARIPDASAFPLWARKFQGTIRYKALTDKIILPGFVFLYAQEPIRQDLIVGRPGFLDVLAVEPLTEADTPIADWIYKNSGYMVLSKVVRGDGTKRFVEGPMVDIPGEIQRIDKRSRCVLTRLKFSFAELSVWLGFYYEDDEFLSLLSNEGARM